MHDICLYPVIDYPTWDEERNCETGLFCRADTRGFRHTYEPLAAELRRQQQLFDAYLEDADAPSHLLVDR